LSGSDPSKNDSIRKEIARQVRSLFKDQRLRIPGRINLIGDLILSPVLLALAAKPVILELLSEVTVNLPWLRYSGQSRPVKTVGDIAVDRNFHYSVGRLYNCLY
jgi:hypothetical protein